MNATQLSLTDGFMQQVADHLATETCALSPFRRLLDEVWRQNDARLGKLAVGLGLRGDQAADALQDVYLMAIHKPPEIEEGEALLRWLFRVTVNRCHLEHRRTSRWRNLWTSLTQASGSIDRPQKIFEHGELKREVERALSTLPDDDRTLVVMRYFSELNSRQIGEIVGLPEATVRSRLRVARRKLAG